MEFLSHPRHPPPAQGRNRPATCGGRLCRLQNLGRPRFLHHCPPAASLTVGLHVRESRLPPRPGGKDIYFRKMVGGQTQPGEPRSWPSVSRDLGVAFSESPRELHMGSQVLREPRGPCHIHFLPPASASGQGLPEPVEAARGAALSPFSPLGPCVSFVMVLGALPWHVPAHP